MDVYLLLYYITIRLFYGSVKELGKEGLKNGQNIDICSQGSRAGFPILYVLPPSFHTNSYTAAPCPRASISHLSGGSASSLDRAPTVGSSAF